MVNGFLLGPLTVQTENVVLENGRIVIVLSVPKGFVINRISIRTASYGLNVAPINAG